MMMKLHLCEDLLTAKIHEKYRKILKHMYDDEIARMQRPFNSLLPKSHFSSVQNNEWKGPF